jgi:hypothetical protein
MGGNNLVIERITPDGTTCSSFKVTNSGMSTLYGIKVKYWIIGDNLTYPPLEE